jgi:hypothetical protein
LLSYVTLNAPFKGYTDLNLKDTITMPGQPAGDMPTFVAGVPNGTGTPGSPSGGSSGPAGSGTNDVTVEREYAANGVCE